MSVAVHLTATGEGPVDDDTLRVRMRFFRDQMLASSDYTMLPDVACDKQAWADYREALREAPDGWVPEPVWEAPEPPASPVITQ